MDMEEHPLIIWLVLNWREFIYYILYLLLFGSFKNPAKVFQEPTILKALIVVNKTAIKMHNQSCLMQTEYCNVQKISDKDLLFATD